MTLRRPGEPNLRMRPFWLTRLVISADQPLKESRRNVAVCPYLLSIKEDRREALELTQLTIENEVCLCHPCMT
jgi:hypothetical protein